MSSTTTTTTTTSSGLNPSLATEAWVRVKATVTVVPTLSGFWERFVLNQDDIIDCLGKSILLELVSSDLDPSTGQMKPTISKYAQRVHKKSKEIKYDANFMIPKSFGAVGAVLVQNELHKEMFLQDIVLEGFSDGPVTFSCYSWAHSKFDNPVKRIFFSNKSFLPSQTPSGLQELREKELELVRGDGTGERKTYDRIYDYDVYNDLGDPDSKDEYKRPVLGSKQRPYPRRCRTGRPPCKKDLLSESRSSSVYVPRDESFADIKEITFSVNAVAAVLHAVIPALETAIVDSNLGFPFFTEIDKLFNEGINVPSLKNQGLKNWLPRMVKSINNVRDSILTFETPALLEKDKFAWFRDEEFSRQTLAGINPYSLKLVTEWPMRSKLDPNVYGPAESAVTKEIIECEIKGLITLEEALEQKKLFVLDYHDLLLPYVNTVRAVKGTTLYGSRTLFLLTPDSTLKVLAIELTRPQSQDKPQWREVYTPGWDATACWLWRVAKAHVLAHDSGYHELVSHWLRTHCCTEPYIIATNRQLSAMHPIYRLLLPHFRYTMEINALARESLINAGGIIETTFSPAQYAMELSSAAYDLEWQFDLQALPADLIHRGLAEEDPTAPHGLKLLIEDFPFANDGLLLWDAIKQWVTEYVTHYYPNPTMVEADSELQSWWTEIRTKGHADKKDEPWWPQLKNPADLIGIITTIVWVASGHHAAVNFGQYDFGGYFPNRPTIARTIMPTEDSPDVLEKFLDKPEIFLLNCFPSQVQVVKVMATLDILSTHSPDEEYLGEMIEPAWAEDATVKESFNKFNESLKLIEATIDKRNSDRSLKNRHGAGIIPYELLKPFSGPGVTMKGVPYSISI